MSNELLEQHFAHDERQFAAIDKKLDAGQARMDKIDEKLDLLVAAANKQKGFIAGVSMAFSLLATTVIGLIVYIWQKSFGG